MATALETNVLEAQSREAGTKGHARRVRREGKIVDKVFGLKGRGEIEDSIRKALGPARVAEVEKPAAK